MRKNTKLQLLAIIVASFLLCVLSASALFFAVSDEYENDLGHFYADSVFAPTVYMCMLGGLILAVASVFVFRKYSAPDCALPQSIASCITSAICASTLLYGLVIRGMEIYSGKDTFDSFTALSFVFGTISIAYLYILALSQNKKRTLPYISLLSFAPVIYCAIEVLSVYFDNAVAVNSPVKTLCQLAYITYMLAFCAETAISLGRGKTLPRYIFTLALTASIGGAVAIAATLVTVSGTECTSLTGADAYLKLAFFIYFAQRFVSLLKMEASLNPQKEKKEEREEITEE